MCYDFRKLGCKFEILRSLVPILNRSPIAPDNKYGVWGQSDTGDGVAGTSAKSTGVKGETATTKYSTAGVRGKAGGSYDPRSGQTHAPDQKCGVWGESDNGYGVAGMLRETSIVRLDYRI